MLAAALRVSTPAAKVAVTHRQVLPLALALPSMGVPTFAAAATDKHACASLLQAEVGSAGSGGGLPPPFGVDPAVLESSPLHYAPLAYTIGGWPHPLRGSAEQPCLPLIANQEQRMDVLPCVLTAGLYYNASPAAGDLNPNRQPFGFHPRALPHFPAGCPLVLETTLSQVS